MTLMREMREWLDHHRAEALFECSFVPGKAACYLEFQELDAAVAFAARFAGRFDTGAGGGQLAA